MTDDGPEYADPERYAELTGFSGEWRDLWWNEDYLRLVARRFGLAERRRTLDLGCGAGHWGLRLLPHLHRRAHLTGADRVPEFFDAARARAEARGLGERVDFVETTAEALPFEDETFDLVTCQTVLIHVADAASVLREARRVLAPGGLLLAAEPDNLAGNMAHFTTSGLDDADIRALVELQQLKQRGKIALGEGDDSIGARLPALFAQAGLSPVRTYTNDRCIPLVPPYESEEMRVDLEQELAWAREGITGFGTRGDARRHVLAGGGSEADFERLWPAAQRFAARFVEDVEAGRYAGARGYVMYLVGGQEPG